MHELSSRSKKQLYVSNIDKLTLISYKQAILVLERETFLDIMVSVNCR